MIAISWLVAILYNIVIIILAAPDTAVLNVMSIYGIENPVITYIDI